MQTRSVTRMRSESYTETQPVVRYRTVARDFPYSALFHEQSIDWSGALTAPLGNQTLTVNTAKRDTAQGDEQGLTNAHVGLAPMHPILIDPLTWTGAASQDWSRDFAGQLRKEWIEQVCRTPDAHASAGDVANSVLKCRREPSAGMLPYVADWYTRSFGMSADDVERMLPEGK
jgi:hypothetical protein